MRRVAKWIGRAALWSLSVGLVLGLTLRWTIQDRQPGISALYYATPPIVLAALALGSGLGWYGSGRRRLGGGLLLVSVACGLWWYQVAFFRNDPRPSSESLKIVFWNPARHVLGRDSVYQELQSYGADILGVVEAGEETPLGALSWRNAFRGYQLTDQRGQMLVLCRGEILAVEYQRLSAQGICKQVDLRLDESELTILLVDLVAAPHTSRRASIDALAVKIDQLADRPVVILGDFNLPGDSPSFAPLRERCRNAFETVGNGLAATWPVPLPVLQIDHVWVNDHIELVLCDYGWSWRSDHRPIEVRLRVKEK